MKHIIVVLSTILVVALAVYTAKQGTAFQGGEDARIIEDIAKNKSGDISSKSMQPQQKSDRDIEAEKLKALRDKAGNVSSFKVSDNYKKKCASCHGVSGEGLVGLPLFGQSAEDVYKKLVEFKSGRRENAIMKGALMNVPESEFKELADEIGEFKARAEAMAK
ncbi:MAG: hypothetical protein PHN38_05405 [Sulfurospirillaceae bacterium]|nr:hypothetical protein [Sulfurospirillaceae bacterium]